MRALQAVRIVDIQRFPVGIKIESGDARFAMPVACILRASEGQMRFCADGRSVHVDDAGLDISQIDVVMGCVSPNTYFVPPDLFALTHRLKFPETTLTIPLA